MTATLDIDSPYNTPITIKAGQWSLKLDLVFDGEVAVCQLYGLNGKPLFANTPDVEARFYIDLASLKFHCRNLEGKDLLDPSTGKAWKKSACEWASKTSWAKDTLLRIVNRDARRADKPTHVLQKELAVIHVSFRTVVDAEEMTPILLIRALCS